MNLRQYGKKARMRAPNARQSSGSEHCADDSLADNPYSAIDYPTVICSREGELREVLVNTLLRSYQFIAVLHLLGHTRKRHCDGNPWCVYGMGEYKEGIWRNEETVMRELLGPDPRLQLRHHINSPCPAPATAAGPGRYFTDGLQTMSML